MSDLSETRTQTSDRWQPIETAPKPHLPERVYVDLWVVDEYEGKLVGQRIADAYWRHALRDGDVPGWWAPHFDYDLDGPIEGGGTLVTHWMPLPEPPKA